ncbi:MAG: trypsin-like peptidase domain-containing protein [Verrucomicrobiales bacterium]|nr:trypsin-like peptidase domain-containing protein [Verrucomicrobiales bacterium]
MFATLRNALLLSVSLLGAAWLYHWGIAGEDRYSLFDVLQGHPVPAVVAQAGGPDVGAKSEPPAPEQAASEGKKWSADELNSTELLLRTNRALADLTESVVPSVVSIDTTTTVDVPRYEPVDPFGFFGYRRSNQRYQAPGLGSGVIVSKEGHILTNHHVVAGVDAIRVTLHSGDQYDAEWVGSDPAADVAVLKIQVKDGPAGGERPVFRPLPFGDSDEVRVGDLALAIGNPFGLSESVTRGIISAKQRRLSDGANEYFQTDAVINPGNSGGPLVDARGHIIGVNTAIFTGQQDVRVWQGIGLAIPSNEAREVYEAIAFGRPLLRGYLGIELSDLTRYQAAVLRLGTTVGALVTDVAKDSPASSVGLLPGDVIVTFDGAEVKSADETLQRIRLKKSGSPVKATVIRKGEPIELTLTVAERPDTTTLKLRSDITASGQGITDNLGMTVRDLTDQEREAFGLRPSDPAIVISDVKPDSQAAQRFLPGDLIHMINRDPVRSSAEFFDLLGSLPKNEQSVIILTRRGQRFYAVLNPGG